MISNGQNVLPAVKRLVELLTARWPNHKKDPAGIIMYRDDIDALVAECGLDRVQLAAAKARTRCAFLPEPAELRELLPVMDSCGRHPDSGRTNWGACWACYSEQHSDRKKPPTHASDPCQSEANIA